MKTTVSALALIATVALAQERCDAPYPTVYCNTTEILEFQSDSCSPYHVFVTRGSDEPYPGRLGNITREICSGFGGNDCTFENIKYPAKSTAWGKDEWCKSAGKGAVAGQSQMKSYSKKCPDSRLILLGYSQGAAVAQDILGGGGGKVFECEQAISPALDPTTAPGSNVVAAVTFGAVIRSRNQNFTIGDTKTFDGKRARTSSQLAALNKYAGVLRDYCHFGDPMCAVGSEPANVWDHLNYFLEHNEEVVPWVVEKAKASQGQSSSPTSVIAKSASVPSATPTRSSSSLSTTTDSSEASPASSANTTTGSAGSLVIHSGVILALSAALSSILLL